MKEQEHIQIIQEQLKLLDEECHIKSKKSCWKFWVQSVQVIESLRTTLIHEDGT